MARFWNSLRNPLSFFGVRSSKEKRVATYVVREHRRGRPLAEILDDPYVRNRCTEQERARLLDQPEVIHAIGEDIVASVRADLGQS